MKVDLQTLCCYFVVMREQTEDVVDLIREHEGRLSSKKRAIAKYIVDHPVEAAFLTAWELAQRTGVSEPTVVRFAMDLGFEGYPEFQERLHHLVQGRLTTIERLKEYHKHLESSRDPAIQALIMDLRNLEETLHRLDLGTVQEVVEEILAAEKIIIIGLRTSQVLAEFMRMALKKSLDSEISLVTSPASLLHEELVHAPKKTLVIGIAFPRYTRMTVEYVKLAHDEGFQTVVLTDSELSPLVEHADHTLLARYGIISYVDSFTAPLSLISAIATAVSLRREAQNLEKLKRLEQMWKAHRVFY